MPHNVGCQLSLWTGFEVSQEDYVALLMCIAVDGHNLVSYQWSRDGHDIPNEVHPLYYATQPRKYACCVTARTEQTSCNFEVKGMCLLVYYYFTYHRPLSLGNTKEDFSAKEHTTPIHPGLYRVYYEIISSSCAPHRLS